MSLFSTTTNYSMYAFPAAWVLSLAPHVIAVNLFDAYRNKSAPKWNNAAPKQQFTQENMKAAQLPKNIADMCLRAEAAQMNGFENLAFFGVALLAGNVARLSASTLNTYAAVYLGLRVAYNAHYILNTSPKGAYLRSLVFVSSVTTCLTLFVKACNALDRSKLL